MIQFNQYYEEFLRYHDLAKKQQELCNLGSHAYEGSVPDDLMCKVELYDVVERKYAGFSQLINDCVYGWTDQHPYWDKMQVGKCTMQREIIANEWTGKTFRGLEEWLYLMLFHRITGSGINYAKKPSGYNNTLLPRFVQCHTIEDMIEVMKAYDKPFYTSVGYQFPSFNKIPPIMQPHFKRAGDCYLATMAPQLIRDLVKFLVNRQHTLREIGGFMLNWNKENGLKQYHFQYAAFVADIADWFPEYVHRESMFYYGSNAEQCISYLAEKPRGMNKLEFLDAVMERASKDTGGLPYNIEDVCCDFIRWVENYVKPGADYDHLDRDAVWSSCKIEDHPFGRQKPMLELGMITSFNNLKEHPTGDKIIRENGLTAEQYKIRVKNNPLLCTPSE